MAKEEMLEFEGVVVEVLPDGRMRVQMDNGHAIAAYTAGRVKKNRIRMIAGDRVTVEMTPPLIRRRTYRDPSWNWCLVFQIAAAVTMRLAAPSDFGVMTAL